MNNRTFLLSAIAAILIGVSTSVFAQEDPLRKYCPEGNCLEIGKKPRPGYKYYSEVHVIKADEIPRRADWNGALYLPQNKLQDAIARVADGGTIYLHKGEYDYSALSWRRRASFNIEAWDFDPVILRPTAQCLVVDPVFHPTKDEPVITLKNLGIAPQNLQGESCIVVENATLALLNVEVNLSDVTRKQGIHVRSGTLITDGTAFRGPGLQEVPMSATNEGVVVDPGATIKTVDSVFMDMKVGVRITAAQGIAALEAKEAPHFSKTAFLSNSNGMVVEGDAKIVEQSKFEGNAVGCLLYTSPSPRDS